MAFEAHIDSIAAGQQFDGTPGKGQFFKGGGEDRTGTKIVRISLAAGPEAKDINVEIVSGDGQERWSVYKVFANTAEDTLILGVVPLTADEWLEIVTSGATAEMRATVLKEDLKG